MFEPDHGLAAAMAVAMLSKRKIAVSPPSAAELAKRTKRQEIAGWNAQVERKKAQRAQAQEKD